MTITLTETSCRNCGDTIVNCETWYDGEDVCGTCFRIFGEVNDYTSEIGGPTIWQITGFLSDVDADQHSCPADSPSRMCMSCQFMHEYGIESVYNPDDPCGHFGRAIFDRECYDCQELHRYCDPSDMCKSDGSECD